MQIFFNFFHLFSFCICVTSRNYEQLIKSLFCYRFCSFKVGVELVQVCWLEVTGMLDLAMLNVSQPTRYEIIYLIKLKADAFGWGQVPISFEVSVPNADRQKKSVSLEQYKEQYDKWLEVSGGCVEIKPGMSGHLEFRMLEVETRWWKGGMVFEGVKIQPYSHK